jgi:hypothetical protein
MQLLRDLNPGNEVQSANQSNQEDGILHYVEKILGQEDKWCKYKNELSMRISKK